MYNNGENYDVTAQKPVCDKLDVPTIMQDIKEIRNISLETKREIERMQSVINGDKSPEAEPKMPVSLWDETHMLVGLVYENLQKLKEVSGSLIGGCDS